jgi:predicted nucleic acid-binding protein
MRRIFADTSFLVSYYNEGDSNHNEARGIAQSLEGENILWVISDYIFDEFLTVLLVRRNKQFAIEVGRAILDDPNMSVVRVEKDIFNNAWKLFSRNKKQIWSFTDSTSYVLIQKLKIVEAVSFDKHFQDFGIKLLT